MGETTAGATTEGTSTPDASPVGDAARTTEGASARHWLRNALPPLGAGLSMREKTALAHY